MDFLLSCAAIFPFSFVLSEHSYITAAVPDTMGLGKEGERKRGQEKANSPGPEREGERERRVCFLAWFRVAVRI